MVLLSEDGVPLWKKGSQIEALDLDLTITDSQIEDV